MAHIIVSSAVSDMVSRAISLLTTQFRNQRSILAKLRTLHHMVIKIQSVVEEAEGRQITSQGLLSWLSELIDGMYQGRYMLDMFRYGVAEASDHSDSDDDDDGSGRSFALSSFNPAKRLRRVAANTTKAFFLLPNNDVSELHHVLANLHLISENLKEFIMLLRSKPPLVPRPITTTTFVDCRMFGRHIERERIITFLLSENGTSPQDLSILPVIGPTGVGKATLVQHVCVDPRVRNYFSSVMLFDSYHIHSMGLTILWNYEDPAQFLNSKLDGRRFLIVIQNLHHMPQLKMILQKLTTGKHGSKIILTSNNRHVASIGTVRPIILRYLPQTEYWFFFKAHASGSTDLEVDQRLMEIGRVIARRLRVVLWC